MSDSKEWNEESAAKEQGHNQSQTISVADLKWQVLKNSNLTLDIIFEEFSVLFFAASEEYISENTRNTTYMPWWWNMMISTLFECTCCKSPNGNDVATKDRHFESIESKYSFKLLC